MKKLIISIGAAVIVTCAAFNVNYALNGDKLSNFNFASLVSLAQTEGCDCNEMKEAGVSEPCYVEPYTLEGLYYCSCMVCVGGGSGCTPTCPCCSN